MLIGEYQHNIDAKGRMIMPSRFREDLGDTFIVTKGLPDCLFVYSVDEWKRLEEQIRSQPMGRSINLQRFFFSGAIDVEVDKQGRILIPQKLRAHAKLVKDVTVIGVSSRCEIWNTELWNEQTSGITSEDILNAMNDLGF